MDFLRDLFEGRPDGLGRHLGRVVTAIGGTRGWPAIWRATLMISWGLPIVGAAVGRHSFLRRLFRSECCWVAPIIVAAGRASSVSPIPCSSWPPCRRGVKRILMALVNWHSIWSYLTGDHWVSRSLPCRWRRPCILIAFRYWLYTGVRGELLSEMSNLFSLSLQSL